MLQYAVQPGDTIFIISAKFGVPFNALLLANPGLSPNNLIVGQIIFIPTSYAYPPFSAPPNPVFPIFPIYPAPYGRYPRRHFVPGRPSMPGRPGPGMPPSRMPRGRR